MRESPVPGDGPAFSLYADDVHFRDGVMDQIGPGEWTRDGVTVRLTSSTTPDGSSATVLEAEGVRRVHEVCLMDHDIDPSPDRIHEHVWLSHRGMQESTTVFCRIGDGGFFACYANPFGRAEISGGHVRLSYRPGIEVEGTFRSDPLIVGPFLLEGREIRFEVLPGRDTVGGQVVRQLSYLAREMPVVLDAGEVRAVRAAVSARVAWEPARARISHWDWGENTFRLDLADEDTQSIYRRIAQLCDELGVEILLLSPRTRTGLDWLEGGPWQHLMWLGMGLDVQEGAWAPGTEPASVTELLETVRSHGLTPAAYSNPQVRWTGRDRWHVQPAEGGWDPDRWSVTCLGDVQARRHVTDTMLRFARAYGLGGFSMDFMQWWPCDSEDHGHVPGSRYAQWDGYRRLLGELLDAGLWTEALIGSQPLMPWGSANMTHPHPVLADNQPQWVPAWPDLSQDRANANYQRRTAWIYRTLAFTPSYKVPGQVGHQANRIREFPVERGWDWEGARYNLLSSLASAPSSTVVCFLPCWDEQEWQGMRDRDGAFFRRWLDFARENQDVLARLEDLYDDPRPGAVDGTIALDEEGGGFVFLTNPDYTPLGAEVPLPPDRILRELHPVEGRLWSGGVQVDPHEVAVLEVLPLPEVPLPVLVGAAGSVDSEGRVESASGRPGSVADAEVWLQDGTRAPVRLTFATDGITPTLTGWSDDGGRAVDLTRLSGDVRIATDWVPGVALPAMLASLAPPVRPEGDEVMQPWSDPSRLRLFPEILDPRAVAVRMRVEGRAVDVRQAYIGTYPDVHDSPDHNHNMLGHYIELTEQLEAEADLSRPWRIELEIDGLLAGRLRGVHVAHLPSRWTSDHQQS